MCPPGYHRNGFMATHALGHMMYGFILLVSMNQKVLNTLSKERNISGHKWSPTQRVLKSHKSKMGVIYVIIKTMCPPGYQHNGFMATHALEHMMYGYTLLLLMITINITQQT